MVEFCLRAVMKTSTGNSSQILSAEPLGTNILGALFHQLFECLLRAK